jgi:small-conductance mechanosensitive channel
MRGASFTFLVLWLGLGVGLPEPNAAAQSGTSSTSSATFKAPATGTPATSTPGTPPGPEIWVKLQDQRVFALRLGRGEEVAEVRARRIGRALEAAAADPSTPEAPRIVPDGPLLVIYLGERPIVQLSAEDAAAAADASLELHAKAIAAQIQQALENERIRSRIANAVFSLSLLVFAGMIAFLLLRRLGQLSALANRYLERREDNLPPLSFSGIEVLSPAMVRATVVTAISIGTRLAQIGIVYLWLVLSLSLFERTRDTGAQLRELLLSPLGQLVGRFGRALPLVIVLVLAVLLLFVVVRFVGLFFASVARGETRLSWLPTELAAPTSVLLRAGLLLAFLVLAGPLILGSNDLVSSMIGIVALLSIGLGSTPLFATAIIGVVVIFGRRYHVGDYVEVGRAHGRIQRLSVLELRLIDDQGQELRVPHLMALLRGAKVSGPRARVTATIWVDPEAPLDVVAALLEETAATVGAAPRVDLDGLDRRAARFLVSIEATDAPRARTQLYARIGARLKEAGHRLGEAPAGP